MPKKLTPFKSALEIAKRAQAQARTRQDRLLTAALVKRYSRAQDVAAEHDFAADLLKADKIRPRPGPAIAGRPSGPDGTAAGQDAISRSGCSGIPSGRADRTGAGQGAEQYRGHPLLYPCGGSRRTSAIGIALCGKTRAPRAQCQPSDPYGGAYLFIMWAAMRMPPSSMPRRCGPIPIIWKRPKPPEACRAPFSSSTI